MSLRCVSARFFVLGLALLTTTPLVIFGQAEKSENGRKGVPPAKWSLTGPVGVDSSSGRAASMKREGDTAKSSTFLSARNEARATRLRRLGDAGEVDLHSYPESVDQLAKSGAVTTFIVNSAYDDPDLIVGNGECFTGFVAGGLFECTLRAAIQEANALAGSDPVNIVFRLRTAPATGYDATNDVWTIEVNSTLRGPAGGPLPPITRANVSIDGETQPGGGAFPDGQCGTLVLGSEHILKVVLDGLLLPGFIGSGLEFDSTAIKPGVRGLVVNNFPDRGIISAADSTTVDCVYAGTDWTGATAQPNFIGVDISGTEGSLIQNSLTSGNSAVGIEVADTSPGTIIEGNLIGTDASGASSLGNAGGGIEIMTGSGSRIGGPAPTQRNVVSGNGSHGIAIATSSHGLTIEGNHIGTNLAGTAALPNTLDGIRDFAEETRIGGIDPGAGNLISGNTWNGVALNGRHTVIEGNLIGTDVSGLLPIANLQDGIHVEADSVTVGGVAPGARNIISGNIDDGVELSDTANVVLGNYIGTDITGTVAIPNSWGVFVSANRNSIGIVQPNAGNVVSGNTFSGILVAPYSPGIDVEKTTIYGNRIGTNASGTAAVGNAIAGIRDWGLGTLIGAPGEAGLNVISGNGTYGIWVDTPASFTKIIGNLIGTNGTGSGAVANAFSGIFLDGGNVTIGGIPGSGEGNVISGNQRYGIHADTGAVYCQILGNYIGVDRGGSTDIGNLEGILLLADNCTIGGPGRGNLISGNRQSGIAVTIFVAKSDIASNLIGTDAVGNFAIPNLTGITVRGDDVTIGGIDASFRNVISGNTNEGILVDDSALNLVVINNHIGTTISGTAPRPNGKGIVVGSSISTMIGSELAGYGNLIAFNEEHGIQATSSSSDFSALRNSIHSNGKLGIDLSGGTEFASGVTQNDFKDTDGGPNELQNYPITGPITNTGGPTTPVGLTLNSLPNSTFRVEFFSSSTVDASGYGEGQRFVVATTLTTDANGDAVYAGSLPTSLAPVGSWISALATRQVTGDNMETSEFSAAVQIAGPKVTLFGKVLLEGAYSGSSAMTVPGSFWSALPTSQPYADVYFDGTVMDYDGPEVVASVAPTVIDWIVVSLRTTTSALDEVAERAAFVRNDGQIVGLDGTAPLTIYGVGSSNYHVVVCHRNHLCAMSPLLDFSTGSATYDFTANPGYTQTSAAQRVLETGPPMVYGLFAGDIDADGQITAPDFNAWLVSTKAVETGYLAPDCDLDGQSTAPDFNLWLVNTKAVAKSQVPG